MKALGLLGLMIFAAFLIGCTSSDDGSGSDTTTTTTLPVVKNLAINNSQFKTTARGGVFDLSLVIGSTKKPFLEFGGKLIDGGTGSQGVNFYHLTYLLPDGPEIISIRF